jgi:hypothetical protein
MAVLYIMTEKLTETLCFFIGKNTAFIGKVLILNGYLLQVLK